jgi:PAS domain S-box-containing protein
MLYDYFWSRNERLKNVYLYKITTGLILGAIGIVLILTPWHFVPGIIFDTRSVMLSVSGLFFGPIPTVITMLVTGTYRFLIGGDGAWMGIAVIASSGTIGLLWRRFRPDWRAKNHFQELLVMGFAVHVIMLACTLFLPGKMWINTLENIAIPVILIYPVATLLLGELMLKQAENWENRRALNISEERWHFALEGAGDGVWDWNPATNEIFYSRQWKLMLGYEDHEIQNDYAEWDRRVFPEDREMVYQILDQHLKGITPEYVSEYRFLCKDGSYKWILDRGRVMTRDETGKPLRFIGTHTDISERKEAQEKIWKLNEELEQKVVERTNELLAKNEDLEKVNKVFVGRELRMVELKETIRKLEEKVEKAGL